MRAGTKVKVSRSKLGELSNVISIAQVQWSCGTCGDSSSSQQLRAKTKPQAIAAPPQPELI
jgi:hypothetical protein